MTLATWLLWSISIAAAFGGLGWLACTARRPAVGHALYVLAFLKLLTPPLFAVTLWDAAPTTVAATQLPVTTAPVTTAPFASAPTNGAAAAATAASTWLTWTNALLLLWVAGTTTALAVFVRRLWQLSAWIKTLPLASSAVRDELRECAVLVGARHVPIAHVTESRAGPMLAPTRHGLRLVLPTHLLAELSPEARRTIYVHELAHLQRRDWLMRFVEMITVAAFWWLPLVYLLRSGLRRTEELCCDAWVAQYLPADTESYAAALLTTANLLSPMPACGMGPVTQLTERMNMLEQTSHRPRLTKTSRAGILALAALLPIVACSSPRHVRIVTLQDDKAAMVLGAVASATHLPIPNDSQKTLLDAVFDGKPTDDADLTRVTCFRYGQTTDGQVAIGEPIKIQVDVREMIKTGATTYNLRVEPGDIIYIPQNGETVPTFERTAPPSRLVLADKPNIEQGDYVSCVLDPALLKTSGVENLRLLTELQAIGESGTIFVPFVGSMKVVGMTTKEAGAKITAELATFLRLDTEIAVRAGRPVATPRCAGDK